MLHGGSFVNLFHLTGESLPVSKRERDEVQAGSYNLDGTLTIEVTRTSADSTLSRIIQLITQAQEAKPRLQKFLDRFGKWYALTIISLAFLLALFLPPLFSIPYLGTEGGIYRALTFLIAASPCALILATPTAYLSAISSCAKRGILLKGGIILDAIASCKAIAFDKTGTLTTGKLSCVSMRQVSKTEPICTEQEALSIAYALERNAVHPIADALVGFAKERGVSPYALVDFKAIPGFGLQAQVSLPSGSFTAFLGHPEFIHSKSPDALAKTWALEDFRKEGHLDTLLLIDETLFLFHFVDTLREESLSLIERLKTRQNLSPIMLTGDHQESAATVARQLGIDAFFANLRPEDKLKKVSEIADKEGLIMVGDGINDAPALARATVGISLGKIGSATAIDASDVVFLNDDLSTLDWLIAKSHQTLAIVKQNITLALSVILCATLPAVLGIVPLWIAVVLHEGGSVLVGLNSLRLLRK